MLRAGLLPVGVTPARLATSASRQTISAIIGVRCAHNSTVIASRWPIYGLTVLLAKRQGSIIPPLAFLPGAQRSRVW